MSLEIDAVINGQNAPRRAKQRCYDALLLDASLRQSLATVRSLGSRGLRIAALTTRERLPAPTFASRWCRHKFVCLAYEGTQDYLAYLLHILQTTSIRVLISSSDGTIALLRQHRAQLEQYTHIALAQEPALSIAINKERTLHIAKNLGIAVPPGAHVQAESDVDAALREIGLPAVVKPTESWDKCGEVRQEVQFVTTSAEAHRAVERLTRMGVEVLVQKFIPGVREAICLFYAQGQVYAQFAQSSRRMNPPAGGASVLRQSIALPADISTQAEQLVRAIDLEGYSMVEFRRDAAGVPYLMEINSRLTGSVDLAVRAGVDFPYLLYQWAMGECIERVPGYRAGIWMRDLAGDIATTAASIVQRGRPGVASPTRAIRDFCASCFVPMRYDYLDSRDLLPVGAAIANWCWHLPELCKSSFVRRKAHNIH